jgi:hypothetical protein
MIFKLLLWSSLLFITFTACSQNSPLDRKFSWQTIERDAEDILQEDSVSGSKIYGLIVGGMFLNDVSLGAAALDSSMFDGMTYREVISKIDSMGLEGNAPAAANDETAVLNGLQAKIIEVVYTDYKGDPTTKPMLKVRLRNTGDKGLWYLESRFYVGHVDANSPPDQVWLKWPSMDRILKYKETEDMNDIYLKPGEEVEVRTTAMGGSYLDEYLARPSGFYICHWWLGDMVYDDESKANLQATFSSKYEPRCSTLKQ